MTIDSIATTRNGRITGTLHKRGYAHPPPPREDERPRELAEEHDAAGRHQDSGQEDHDAGH